jgi:hypothetical protein
MKNYDTMLRAAVAVKHIRAARLGLDPRIWQGFCHPAGGERPHQRVTLIIRVQRPIPANRVEVHIGELQ